MRVARSAAAPPKTGYDGAPPSASRMRIGIFSDTHANIEALTAVVEAFKAERIDQ